MSGRSVKQLRKGVAKMSPREHFILYRQAFAAPQEIAPLKPRQVVKALERTGYYGMDVTINNGKVAQRRILTHVADDGAWSLVRSDDPDLGDRLGAFIKTSMERTEGIL